MTPHPSPGKPTRPVPSPSAPPDLAEKGRAPDGSQLRSDHRLFMQLQVFTDCLDPDAAVQSLADAGVHAVVYEDVRDPLGIAVLAWHKNPAFFVQTLRPLIADEEGPFLNMTPVPAFTMFGRTYALGYEPDLQETLFDRPIRNATNPDTPWAIWYPLRRGGPFEQLDAAEQRKVLMEHGTIGKSYGDANLAHDIRLASHGLDPHDNDFTIGLMGSELHPLSALVQRMRKTVQTSQYLENLGPFFVGHRITPAPLADGSD